MQIQWCWDETSTMHTIASSFSHFFCFHPCFYVFFYPRMLSPFMSPLHLLQLLNLHTCFFFSSFSLLPLCIPPAYPTWYASFIFFFVYLCPCCQFSYSFYSSIHLLIICPERQSETGSKGRGAYIATTEEKSGLIFFYDVPNTGGPHVVDEAKKKARERNLCNSPLMQKIWRRSLEHMHSLFLSTRNNNLIIDIMPDHESKITISYSFIILYSLFMKM